LFLYLLFSCIAVSSFFWSFIFCSVVLPFLLSFGPLSSVQLYCNGNTTKQKIKDQKKEETAIQLNRRYRTKRKKKRQYNGTEDKEPKERRNGNTTEQKIKNQKKEETAIQLNRR
jgi:hypothetical protein